MKKILRHKLNQRGMGLIGVMVAAALVVIAAFTVANFVSDQHHQSARLQISGDCQNIANSLVEYIKKDEASLFISSYGPNSGTNTFPSSLDQTDDGVDRFRFSSTPVPFFTSPGGTSMTVAPTPATGNAPRLPTGWRYYNHLNIKNSTNRLVALAARDNFCCDGLNMNNPGCGTRFYDDANPRPGFRIADRDVEVDLAVDFSGSNCVAQKLAMANLPDSQSGTKADFKVRVTMKRGTPQQKVCEGTGTVQRTADTSSSLTLVQFDSLCTTPTMVAPAVCTANTPIRFHVRTFKSTSGTNCHTNCLKAVQSRTCAQLAGPEPDMFDTFNNAICAANCLQSEPGTAFLCRIGEKSWFDNPANANTWEPCEQATVKDHDGSVAGNVEITYAPLVPGNDDTQKTSNATITLRNLRDMRGYMVDVRAVDTAGNIGPSFCKPGVPVGAPTDTPSCLPSSPPHFSVITAVPVMGPVGDTANLVAGAAGGQLDSNTAIRNRAGYENSMSAFGANQYQCRNGGPVFTGTVQYTPPLTVGPSPLAHTCSAVLTSPSGVVNIPSGGPAQGFCNCVGADCSVRVPALATGGAHILAMTAYNDCGRLPDIPNENWCLDTGNPLNVTVNASNSFGDTPTFGNIFTGVTPAKPCGVATLCPNVNATFTSTLGTSCGPGGWDPMVHSGCTEDPNGNFCAIVLDPCGRYKETNTPTPRYSSTLAGVPHNSPAAAHQCFRYNGQQVGGNVCEGGAYCDRLGKCRSTCPRGGMACSASTDCEDPSYGATSAEVGGPQCIGGRCTCPSNTSTPAAGPCSPVMCNALNSCTTGIGTPSGAVTTCQACENWSVGNWSLCIGGQRTRSVTCPGTCCIGPQPPTTVTCPDCITPWGTDFLHGTSITAFQSGSVGCGATCASEVRTCNNGVISGSFTSASCSATPCASCALPWGGAIGHGQSVTAYTAGSVGCGGDCSTLAQTRTCTDGVLSGSAGSPSCSVNCACPVGPSGQTCSWRDFSTPDGPQQECGVVASPFIPCNESCCPPRVLVPGCWKTYMEDACLASQYNCARGPGQCDGTSCTVGDRIAQPQPACFQTPRGYKSRVKECEPCP